MVRNKCYDNGLEHSNNENKKRPIIIKEQHINDKHYDKNKASNNKIRDIITNQDHINNEHQ
jgi:hypothetical protein